MSFYLSELTHDELIEVKCKHQRQHTNARADLSLVLDPGKKLALMRKVQRLEALLHRIYNEFERRARAPKQSLYPW